jgi:large subunit ribosomal protein L6
MQKKKTQEEGFLPIVTKIMKENIIKEIELSEGISATLSSSLLKVKGPKGEVERDFLHPKIKLNVDPTKITLSAIKATKREKTMIGSFLSHIKNMVKGVTQPFVYKLKICSGHFPMNVSVKNNEVTIKNLFGESVPRKTTFALGVEVKVDGTDIIVTSVNKENAGQTAAKIESLCKITNRDRRIFQDGCYIIDKAGKIIS